MPSENLFAVCANLPSPVLTVYLNTVPQDATRHPRVRPELAWFLDMAETLRQGLSHPDAKQFERQVRRVRRFLEQRHPAERAVVVFAGAKNWLVIPLHVSLRNNLYWGAPRIDPLLPLLHAHRRYGFLVMDHMAVRYFELADSGMSLLGSKQF